MQGFDNKSAIKVVLLDSWPGNSKDECLFIQLRNFKAIPDKCGNTFKSNFFLLKPEGVFLGNYVIDYFSVWVTRFNIGWEPRMTKIPEIQPMKLEAMTDWPLWTPD